MLKYVVGKLGFGAQPQEEEDEDYSSESEVEEPQPGPSSSSKSNGHAVPTKTKIISETFDALSVSDETKEKVESADEREVVSDVGIITRLDLSMPKGVINRTYQFDIASFCEGKHSFTKGSKVTFEAFRSKSTPSWVVTRMEPHVSEKEVARIEANKHLERTVVIERVMGDVIQIKWGKTVQKIPIVKDIFPSYKLKKGDWLKIHFEKLSDEPVEGNSEECVGRIVSVEPNRMKKIVGKVSKRDHVSCIDDEIYYTLQEVEGNRELPENNLVSCTAVESTQHCGNVAFQWRAVEVSLSKIMAHTQDSHNRDENGFFDGPQITNDFDARPLYLNRDGIKILPSKYIKFQATKIKSSSMKSVTIINNSQPPRIIALHRVTFPRKEMGCSFELNCPRQEKNVIKTLDAGESYEVDITCTPLQMGRTKEMGIFDFGDFKVARDFIITGLSDNIEIMDKIIKPDDGVERRYYQRVHGMERLDQIVKDTKRTRIRGTAPVRAPFFIPARIPRFPIPETVWDAARTKCEDIIIKNHRDALYDLCPANYRHRFHLSLWFEEVDNDIRRRLYDLVNVRLSRLPGNQFKFLVPHISDIYPPILNGDPVDVFDPEQPEQPKYQGFICKMQGTEVYAEFSENFVSAYNGTLLTVQFCLGRMTYKRQHFSVDFAFESLGERFLFPFGFMDCEVQEPRIPFYEDEKDDEDTAQDVIPETSDNPAKLVNPEEPLEISDIDPLCQSNNIFRKAGEGRKQGRGNSNGFNVTPVSKDSKLDHKRAHSLRKPFVSDTVVTDFTEDVGLRWFNKGLNEEQKNAVRRVLRGQARPLPYIIFGPPGTGKTVTVVEAVMQVNKLDRNSRILVTAPTNHAADVIAEQLVRSGKFIQGEFVRFNGFLRHEQGMIESIRDYCVDGEYLDNVAQHRLIISTCATAGQFFSLNLTPGHFTHVFIDEAGYCTEPEAMISAVTLALDKGGQLILAGDPNQLGPVLMSDVSQNLELNLSFLERLMKGFSGKQNIYGKNVEQNGTENCGYNSLVLTKLVKNYRAHQTLLKLPSRLFYDDDLVSCASFEEAYQLTQDKNIIEKILISHGVPIVFHGVQGNSVREADSPSWYNAAEVMQVVSYVLKLKACNVKNEDIGIITPYRKQAEKLRTALQFALGLQLKEDDMPKVGSVEEFQGGERHVIIISTVRSMYEEKIDAAVNRLGFLFNEKRFNVAITRAKSLMIIVGNPHIVKNDQRWIELLRYCIELGAYTGCNLPPELDALKQTIFKEMKEQEVARVPVVAPPDMPTETYNPDGLDGDNF